MSDEEDTTILLGRKTEDREKISTTLVLRSQSVAVNGQNFHESSPSSQRASLLVCLVTMMGGLAFGFEMGIGPNMSAQMKETFSLTCKEQHLISWVWLVGAVTASFVGCVVGDRFHRHWLVGFSMPLVIVSAVTSALAADYCALMWGRLLGGFAATLSAIAQCACATESSPAVIRGRGVTLLQLGAAGGLLTASVTGGGAGPHWRTVVWLGAVPSVIQGLVTVLFLSHAQGIQPYVPSHKAVRRARSLPELYLLTVAMVLFQQSCGRPTVLYYAPSVFSLVGVCPDMAPAVTSIILNVIRVVAVLLSLNLVDRLGRRPSIIVGTTCMMLCLATLGAIATVADGEEENPELVLPKFEADSCRGADVGGAMPLVLHPGGTLKLATVAPQQPTGIPPPFPMLPTPVSLVAEDTYAVATPLCGTAAKSSLSVPLRYLAVIAVVGFEVAYWLGLGCASWVLLAEIFPTRMRIHGLSVGLALRWVADMVVPITFVPLMKSLTLEGSFLLYSIICSVAVIFVFLLVPETKGKSFQQIAQGFRNMSLNRRLLFNLQGIPCLSNNKWLQAKSRQYWQVSRNNMAPAMENTSI